MANLEPLQSSRVRSSGSPPCILKEEIRSQYWCWWLRKFANPNHSPKLRTFRLFKTSFGTSPYLDFGPYYLRPALLRFRCSNHRLDIELGRHINVPRQDRSCRFCQSSSIGDEFHAFKCTAFMDLQVLCGVNVTSFPQFIAAMQSFEIHTQRYISLVMSRIKPRENPMGSSHSAPIYTLYYIHPSIYTTTFIIYTPPIYILIK